MNDRVGSGTGAPAAEGSGRDAVWDGTPDGAPPGGAGVRLVLAEDGARVLHAAPGAGALVRALAPEGALPPALARQIRHGRGIRMLRLRLDPRGIAPPTLCRVAPGRAADGQDLLLLTVAGPLPVLLRARPEPERTPPQGADPAPGSAPGSGAQAVPETAAPAPGDRFLWRSDAAGGLAQLSGGGDALARLVGASWPDLAAAGRLGEAGPLLDALAQRRTFRGLGAVLALEGGLSVAADLSGTPLGRSGQAFQGYGGFGIVRAITVRQAEPPDRAGDAPADGAARPEETEPGEVGPAGSPPRGPSAREAGSREAPGPVVEALEAGGRPGQAPPAAGAPATGAPAPREQAPLAPPYALAPPFGQTLPADPVAMATMAAPLLAAWLQQDWFGAAARPVPATDAARERVDEGVHEVVNEPTREPAYEPAHELPPDASAETAPDIVPEPEAPQEMEAPQETEAPAAALSISEHDAFREIARALGVRYAGDLAGDLAGEAAEALPADPAARGAVMPFSFAAPMAAVRSEPEPAALLDGVPGPLLLHRGAEILAANRALLDLAGYPDLAALRAAGLGRLFPELPPEAGSDDASAILETRGDAVRRVAVARGAMPWPGGAAVCLLLRPLPDGDGADAALPPAGQSRAVPALEADPEADMLRAALDAVAEGVVVADAAGRVLALNRAAAERLGRDPRAARGAPLRDLLPEAGGVPADPDGRTIAIDGQRLAVRVAALAKGRRALLLRSVPEAPRPEGAGFVARFLAQLDREIRAPLTGILGFADVMLKEPYGPLGHARYRSYLSDIRVSGEQVLGLVADLVDLATVETGGLPLSRRPLPLNDLVSACVAEMQAEAARGRIVLRTSFAEDLAPLEADEPSLARAARLVIGNAIRLAGAGGQVIVSTNPAERGAVALRVRDTGTGMSPEEIAFALEPFRGPRPKAGGPDGGPSAAAAGLGLPLSRALVEANDGRLTISSRKDEGTLVEILLPGRAARRA